MFLIGQLSVGVVSVIVTFAIFFPERQEIWVVWLVLIGCLALGALAGYATQRWGHIGVMLIGFWLGAILGSMIYSGVIIRITNQQSIFTLWFTITFSGLLMAYLS